ncbi:hypothetical protein KL86PLE_110075 [uncultured Pleomorphomonas sp.]|uniref:Uncharacterized protein n=1 Tax=uncultured Pleomorphomonas sp. TaxID=442121 RepID=A0A212L7K4_9HYPH|nr:hypothetical protein [uncultured Pleomorphomonas sp.]SCM73457.1 hypothetical protein KL86PLE_110075 [uncultured Pleomorphomonas sp.]
MSEAPIVSFPLIAGRDGMFDGVRLVFRYRLGQYDFTEEEVTEILGGNRALLEGYCKFLSDSERAEFGPRQDDVLSGVKAILRQGLDKLADAKRLDGR